MPKARSLGVAASILAFSLPEGLVNASRVVAGERSDRISSVRRGRAGDLVGDREADRMCVRGMRLGRLEGSIVELSSEAVG
jgi:hypothetical protein